jgi:hypothetical protein
MSTLLMRLTKPSVTNEPPSPQEMRRNEIAVIVTLIVALLLGGGIRNNSINNSRAVELGAGLPEISIPANWIKGTSPDYLVSVRNQRSAGIFDSEITVAIQPLAENENEVTVRTALGLKRGQELLRYRELEATPVTVGSAEDVTGILVTYAYVADPTREQGAVAAPVVVQAQDLIFTANGNAVIVTMAADAAHWDDEESYFDLVKNSLRVKEGEE